MRNPLAAFTLLEVMVALMLLSVALIGTLGSLIAIAALNATTKENNYTLFQARRVMEEVRATPFDNIYITYQSPGKDVDVPGLAAQDGDVDGKVGKVIATQVAGNLQLLDVTVELRWKGKYGNRQITVRTRITKLGG